MDRNLAENQHHGCEGGRQHRRTLERRSYEQDRRLQENDRHEDVLERSPVDEMADPDLSESGDRVDHRDQPADAERRRGEV